MLHLLTFHPAFSLLLGVLRFTLWSHVAGHCDARRWTGTYRDDAAGRGVSAVVCWEAYTTSGGELVLNYEHWTAPTSFGSNSSITEWPYQSRRERERPLTFSTRPKARRSVLRVVVDVLAGRDRRPRFACRRRVEAYGTFRTVRVPVWAALLAAAGPSPGMVWFGELPLKSAEQEG